MSAIFCFTFSTLSKCFPVRTLFIWGKKKRCSVADQVGHGDHPVFGQKLLNVQHGVGRSDHKSPNMKWANALKVFQKNSLKLNAASHNNASWHNDNFGFGGSLFVYWPTRWWEGGWAGCYTSRWAGTLEAFLLLTALNPPASRLSQPS